MICQCPGPRRALVRQFLGAADKNASALQDVAAHPEDWCQTAQPIAFSIARAAHAAYLYPPSSRAKNFGVLKATELCALPGLQCDDARAASPSRRRANELTEAVLLRQQFACGVHCHLRRILASVHAATRERGPRPTERDKDLRPTL